MIKDTQGPTKSKPEVADGKGFPHTDKKLLNRLGDETGVDAGSARATRQRAPEDRASDDPNAPRRVRTHPDHARRSAADAADGRQPRRRPSGAVMVVVPGVTLENMGPAAGARRSCRRRGASLGGSRAASPPAGMPPVRAVQQPPVRVASAANMPPPAAAEPAAPVQEGSGRVKAAPEKAAVPKTKEASAAPAATASSGAGFVAVLSSQKSRMDALKIFANMQEKYGDVLASRTPDVQEANLGEKGVWYRLVVGPPGSREAAAACARSSRPPVTPTAG